MKANRMNKDLTVLYIGMAILNLFVFLISLFWSFQMKLILGLLIGYLYMCWNLWYLNYSIKNSVSKSVSKAKNSFFSSYIIRYAILGVIVVFAIQTGYVSYIGICIPLFYPKIVLTGYLFILDKKGK